VFEIADPSIGMKVEIGIPEKEFGEYGDTLDEKRRKIANYFSMKNPTANYEYDFGDSWEHKIQLEKILPREKDVNYPRCIGGKRACPPEDCGGIWGYERLLEILKDPKHEEYEEMLEWVGGEFDPELFDADNIVFSDPDKRLRMPF